MYREIIEIKETVSADTLAGLKRICAAAHKNRAGEVKMTTLGEHIFCFEGTEKDYGCLMLASLSLNRSEMFKSFIKNWRWEDKDPDENCDILKSLAIPVRV